MDADDHTAAGGAGADADAADAADDTDDAADDDADAADDAGDAGDVCLYLYADCRLCFSCLSSISCRCTRMARKECDGVRTAKAGTAAA